MGKIYIAHPGRAADSLHCMQITLQLRPELVLSNALAHSCCRRDTARNSFDQIVRVVGTTPLPRY